MNEQQRAAFWQKRYDYWFNKRGLSRRQAEKRADDDLRARMRDEPTRAW